MRIYQDAKGTALPVTVTARIADTSDQVVLSEGAWLTADRFAADRSADYPLELPVERLEAGEYLLTIEGTQKTLTARSGVRFTVQ